MIWEKRKYGICPKVPGGGVNTQIQFLLVLILVVLRYNSVDGIGGLIPIFGFNLQGEEGGSTKSLDEIHTFILKEDLPYNSHHVLSPIWIQKVMITLKIA